MPKFWSDVKYFSRYFYVIILAIGLSGLIIYKTKHLYLATHRKVLIAFGDSLTCGYQRNVVFGSLPRETPYINYLKPLLGNNWALESKGKIGELTGEMLTRFNQDVIRCKPNIVVILGGANDIGKRIAFQAIIKNLKTMIQLALDAGIIPVPCAIPSLVGLDYLIPPRQKVNEAISRFAREKNLYFVDLFTATADEKKWLAQKYSNDGLHLNTSGYKLMAKTIYEQALKKIVEGYKSRPLPL